MAEMEKARIGAIGVTIVVMPQKVEMKKGMVMPSTTPISPPTAESITASTRNWVMMSDLRAPSARRMPISRVRSVTLASMMFIMPMPPTSSEMPAMAPATIWSRRALSSAWRSRARGISMV